MYPKLTATLQSDLAANRAQSKNKFVQILSPHIPPVQI